MNIILFQKDGSDLADPGFKRWARQIFNLHTIRGVLQHAFPENFEIEGFNCCILEQFSAEILHFFGFFRTLQDRFLIPHWGGGGGGA